MTVVGLLVAPGRLEVVTDVVGYPIHSDFNINVYYYRYVLLVAVLPGTVLVAFLAIQWIRGTRFRPAMARRAPVASADGGRAWSSITWLVWAVGLTAVVLALESAIVLRGRFDSVWFLAVGIGIVYGGMVFGIPWIVNRLSSTRVDLAKSMALFNSAGVATCVLGLYGVSRSTQVTIISSGEVHRFGWLPLWLAGVLAVAVLVCSARSLRLAAAPEQVRRVHQLIVGLVALPIGFFVLLARLPGDLAPFSSFESGQRLIGAGELLDGAFPWRDVLLTHGPLHDGLFPMLGMTVFERSAWGASAGYSLFVTPLYWLAVFFMLAYLLRGRWGYLVVFVIVTLLGHDFLDGFLAHAIPRLGLVPIALIAFGLLLERATWPRALVFAALVCAQVVVTPEAGFVIPAFALTLVLFEASTSESGLGILAARRYPRLIRVGASTLFLVVVFSIYLAANDSLGSFVFFFRSALSAHLMAGGIPIDSTSTTFDVAVYLPVVVALLFVCVMATRVLRRLDVPGSDWVMTALSMGTIFYYPKFLARADQAHLFQVLALSTPFLYYAAFRLVDWFRGLLAARSRDGRGAWSSASAWTVVGVLVVIVAGSLGPIESRVRLAPARFRATAQSEPVLPRLGFSRWSSFDYETQRVLEEMIQIVGGPSGRVWDFSNSPTNVYFLLDSRPPTRFPVASLALTARTQRDLIGELRRERPEVIVYDSITGLSSWDGVPNAVRHYDVSAFLLDHYRPVAVFRWYVVLARDDLPDPRDRLLSIDPSSEIVVGDDAVQGVAPCDWGSSPAFFSGHPARSSSSAIVTRKQLGLHAVFSGSTFSGTDEPVAVLVRDGNEIVEEQPVDRTLHRFGIRAPIDDASDIERLEVWLRLPGGTEEHLGGGGIRSRQVGLHGSLDEGTAVFVDRLRAPADAVDYRWLELRTTPDLRADRYSIREASSAASIAKFAIGARSGDRALVPLDNCPAWRFPRSSELLLTHEDRETELELKLIR